MATAPSELTATARWLARDADAIGSVLSRATGIVADSASGSWITDVDGNRWLDFATGIAVCNVGHCHPQVVEAVTKQAAKLMHTSVVTRHAPGIECAEQLVRRSGIADGRVFFCNTGAEAVEGSIKMARRVTGRPGIVAFRGAFHGRSMGATTMTTAKGRYREGYGPLLPGVHIAEFPRTPDRVSEALADLDAILSFDGPASQIASMVVEPVMGEGGYIPAPLEFLEGLRERCDAHGILLVFDEVQTGAGRTGDYFASTGYGVTPDLTLFAKGVASGMPLAGIIASADLFDRWPTGTHGTTFGGNPVACAAALATMKVIDEEGLLERVRENAPLIVSELAGAAGSRVVDVRGRGYMIGVEFADADAAKAAQAHCLANNLIVLVCGPGDKVVRLIPALNATDHEFELAVEVLSGAIAGTFA